MSSIRAYSQSGAEFEKRDFGSIQHPNHDLIEFLATKAGTPVARFTLRESWWGKYRYSGIYTLGGATAEIERHADRKPSGEFYTVLEIECTDLKEGQELYKLIRSGRILPTTSFDDNQIDNPVLQLRDLIRIWWKSVITSIRSRMTS